MLEFKTEQEAWNWIDSLDLDYRDNERFAFMDNEDEMIQYEKQQTRGCCGFIDEVIMVDGKLAQIGCNYGH